MSSPFGPLSIAIIFAPAQRADRSLNQDAIIGIDEIKATGAHLGGGLGADNITGFFPGHLAPLGADARDGQARRRRAGERAAQDVSAMNAPVSVPFFRQISAPEFAIKTIIIAPASAAVQPASGAGPSLWDFS
jgi:hypothetical protein